MSKGSSPTLLPWSPLVYDSSRLYSFVRPREMNAGGFLDLGKVSEMKWE